MSSPPRVPPRFVPTLTEVVQVPDSRARGRIQSGEGSRASSESSARQAVELHRSDVTPPTNVGAAVVMPSVLPAQPMQLQDGTEEDIVHRVMQRVDVVLEKRLRDAIATVVQEQTRSLLPRLREEIESVVRHAVYEAVADELAGGEASPRLR